MKLTDFVIKEAIIPELSASAKEDVIREMVAQLKNKAAIKSEDEDEVVAAVLKREELGSPNDAGTFGEGRGLQSRRGYVCFWNGAMGWDEGG